MSQKSVSIELIKIVASGLGELNDRAVFVGGATVPFYLPKETSAAARPTEDIRPIQNTYQGRQSVGSICH